MKLVKYLILLLLIYEITAGHKKKKHHKRCHKKHKHLPGSKEVENDDKSTVTCEDRIFHGSEKEPTDTFENPIVKIEEEDHLSEDLLKWINDHQTNDHFAPEDVLKKVINKFLQMILEKCSTVESIEKLPLKEFLTNDSLKYLLMKCFKESENDFSKKLLEMSLKDVIDKNNLDNLKTLFGTHENSLKSLLRLSLKEIFHLKKEFKDLFKHDLASSSDFEKILESILHLPLTKIFDIKKYLPLNIFEENIEKVDHLEDGINLSLIISHKAKDSLIKFLVGSSITGELAKTEISQNLLHDFLSNILFSKILALEKEIMVDSIKSEIYHKIITEALIHKKIGENILKERYLKQKEKELFVTKLLHERELQKKHNSNNNKENIIAKLLEQTYAQPANYELETLKKLLSNHNKHEDKIQENFNKNGDKDIFDIIDQLSKQNENKNKIDPPILSSDRNKNHNYEVINNVFDKIEELLENPTISEKDEFHPSITNNFIENPTEDIKIDTTYQEHSNTDFGNYYSHYFTPIMDLPIEPEEELCIHHYDYNIY